MNNRVIFSSIFLDIEIGINRHQFLEIAVLNFGKAIKIISYKYSKQNK